MRKSLLNSKVSGMQMLLMVISSAAYLISNVTTNFQWEVAGLTLTGGILVFPITYILSDVFSEIYGYKWSRRNAWICFGVNLAFVLLLQLLFILPAAEWTDVAMWQTVLGSTFRILIGSFLAFIIGGWVDDLVFKKMQEKHGKKKFSLRAILSSFIGEIFDSLIFYPIAFLGTLPMDVIFQMMVVGVIIKTGYEIVILPVTQWVVKKLDAMGERKYYEA